MTSNALMMSGEPASACAVVTRNGLIQTFAVRALAACQAFAGDSAGALAAAPDLRATEPQLAALLQSAASGQPAAGVPAGPARWARDDDVRSRPRSPAARSAAGERPADDPRPGRRPLAADRDPGRGGERGEASAIIEATRLSDLYVLAVRDGRGYAGGDGAGARGSWLLRAMPAMQDEIMQSLVAVYGEARGSPLFATVARASASSLLTLPAKPEYANVAQEAIRGLLLLGDSADPDLDEACLTSVANNARAIIALERMLAPGRALPPSTTLRRLSVGGDRPLDDLMQQDDPSRAPLSRYLLLELLRATGRTARGSDRAA
jgi:hypothetical protein